MQRPYPAPGVEPLPGSVVSPHPPHTAPRRARTHGWSPATGVRRLRRADEAWGPEAPGRVCSHSLEFFLLKGQWHLQRSPRDASVGTCHSVRGRPRPLRPHSCNETFGLGSHEAGVGAGGEPSALAPAGGGRRPVEEWGAPSGCSGVGHGQGAASLCQPLWPHRPALYWPRRPGPRACSCLSESGGRAAAPRWGPGTRWQLPAVGPAADRQQ